MTMASSPAFAEFIAENLRSVVDLTWDLADGRVLARFGVEDLLVEVQFEERVPGEWTIAFELVTTPKSLAYLAFHMFNGVFQAVEEFVSVRNPDAVVFVAKRADLAHIYEIFLHREQHRIADLGYKLRTVQKVDPFVEYVIKRVNPSGWSA